MNIKQKLMQMTWKKKALLSVVVLSIVVGACTPSTEEIAAERGVSVEYIEVERDVLRSEAGKKLDGIALDMVVKTEMAKRQREAEEARIEKEKAEARKALVSTAKAQLPDSYSWDTDSEKDEHIDGLINNLTPIFNSIVDQKSWGPTDQHEIAVRSCSSWVSAHEQQVAHTQFLFEQWGSYSKAYRDSLGGNVMDWSAVKQSLNKTQTLLEGSSKCVIDTLADNGYVIVNVSKK